MLTSTEEAAMVMRREPDREPESGVVPEEWRSVRDWLRNLEAVGVITPLVCIRAWVAACFLNAIIDHDLPSPDSLEHDAAGAVRFTWEQRGPHRFEVTISPAGLVDLDYCDRATGTAGGLFEVAGIVMTPDLDQALRRAAGLPPTGEDPS
jgi:hypothetical protein